MRLNILISLFCGLQFTYCCSFLSFRNGFIASQGDGSCFIVQQDLNYVTEITGADCDPVYKVATWEKQIYTCCWDGLVRCYQLSDLWPLRKRNPSQWKRLTLINSEQEQHQGPWKDHKWPLLYWVPFGNNRKSAALAHVELSFHDKTHFELSNKLTCALLHLSQLLP